MDAQQLSRKACGSCIALKVKCTQTRPCERCVRRGVECVDVESKRRLPRPKKFKQTGSAVELLAKLLPTINPLDLLKLNIITANNAGASPLPIPQFSSSTTECTHSHFLADSLSPPSPLSPVSPSDLSPLSLALPSSPLPSTDVLLQLENDLMGVTEPLPDFSVSQISPPTSPTYIPTISTIPNTPTITTISTVSTVSKGSKMSGPILELSDKLAHLMHKLSNDTSDTQQTEVLDELRAVKYTIERYIEHAQTSRPKEINISPGVIIANPETFKMRDCNDSFLKMVGFPKEALYDNPLSVLSVPQFGKIIKRDLEWLLNIQKVTSGKRYMAMRHANGGAVYTLGNFEVIGPSYAILTIGTIFDDIPRCLQYACLHYMGVDNAYKKTEPPRDCTIEFCQCKLVHLPLPPAELDFESHGAKDYDINMFL